MSGAKLADSAVDRDILITENMGLVHACAHRFAGKGIEYEDLFQAGCMGLVKAFDAFDTERGVKFSTYAVPVILGNLFQLFYTLADSVIVGKMLDSDALAAVGSTSIIIYFVFCFIIIYFF